MYIRRAFGNGGEDRVSGVITKAHVGGLIGGAIGGLGLGALLGGGWTISIVLALLGAVLGVGSALRVRGMTVREHLWLRVQFQVRRARGRTAVPPSVSLSTISGVGGGRTLILEGRVIARPYVPEPVTPS